MAIRHVVFVECSRAVDDPYLQDVFLALAYGMLPLYVTEDESRTHLLFRRTVPASPVRVGARRCGRERRGSRQGGAVGQCRGAASGASRPCGAEKKKKERPPSHAVDVVWYNTVWIAAGERGGDRPPPLHVNPTGLGVAWAVRHPVDVHARMVPVLMDWCQWDRDAAWRRLRTSLTTAAAAPPGPPFAAQSRTQKAAAIAEWVGERARRRGRSATAAAALCAAVLRAYQMGRVEVTVAPDGRAVAGVTVEGVDVP